MTKQELKELQELPIPRCSLESFTEFNGVKPEDKIDEYLSHFAPPHATEKAIMCLGCGERLWSDPIQQAMGLCTFTWGIAHGEGMCQRCKYPTRFYHKLESGREFSFPLQYHPDELEAGGPAR